MQSGQSLPSAEVSASPWLRSSHEDRVPAAGRPPLEHLLGNAGYVRQPHRVRHRGGEVEMALLVEADHLREVGTRIGERAPHGYLLDHRFADSLFSERQRAG